jgi:hypothetical protein
MAPIAFSPQVKPQRLFMEARSGKISRVPPFADCYDSSKNSEGMNDITAIVAAIGRLCKSIIPFE